MAAPVRDLARRRSRSLIVLTAWLATATAAAPVQAAPDALEWSAPSGCPDAGQVRRRVEELSGRPAASWRFAIRGRVVRSDSGWWVSLDFSRRGPTGERVFHGETCAAVSEAAALHIALGMEVTPPAPGRSDRPATLPGSDDEKAPPVAIEVAAGLINPGEDESSLDFERSGYARTDEVRAHLSLAAVVPLSRHLSLVGALSTLSGAEYARVGAAVGPMAYSWRAYSVGAQARASWPLGSRLTPFVQAGAGATLAFDTVIAPIDDNRSESLGWHVRGGGGLLVRLSRSVALFSEAAYIAAPVHFSRNIAAQDYQSGGAVLILGGRLDFHRGDGP
jgi:opacity protein-like surface antigen